MKAKIHLLEHELGDSLLVKNLSQAGTPLYVRFEEDNEDKTLQPCDFLVVCKPKEFIKDDICLIYNAFDKTYRVDRLKEIIKMTDIDSNLRDVFVGLNSYVPIDDVQKVIASTFTDELVPEIEGNFTAKCIFKYNTGEPIVDVYIKTDDNGELLVDDDNLLIDITDVNPDIKKFGDVSIETTETGLVFTVDPDKFETSTVNMYQLRDIVSHIEEMGWKNID